MDNNTPKRKPDWNPEKVAEFLNEFTSKATIRLYRYHIRNFFKINDKHPDEYLKDVRLMNPEERLRILDRYEKDIKKYHHELIEIGRSPTNITVAINTMRVFLKHHKIYLDDEIWKNIKRRGLGNKPVTEETPITNEVLKKILQYGDVRSRAIFLVMASSGCRIGELIKLKIQDINFNSNPTKLVIRYTGANSVKNKSSRITYISDEATSVLKEWLIYREKSNEYSKKRSNLPKSRFIADDRVFPYCENNIRYIWTNLLKKSELNKKDPQTERYMIHPHSLRKFFRTKFSKQNRDVAEILMGHEGYLSSNYIRLTEEEIKKEYLIGMKYLQIFEIDTTDQRVTVLDDQLKEKDKQIQELKDQMQMLMAKVLTLDDSQKK